MRQKCSHESLGNLCALFGVTRQAYYEAAAHEKKTSIAHMIVLTLIKDLRHDLPFLGTRKIHHVLLPEMEAQAFKHITNI